MPEISRFFGIVIAMYYNDHEPPHFHARYGSQRGRFEIEGLTMVEGNLRGRAKSLVTEWAALHLDELRHDWALARSQQPLVPIAPLE